MFTESPALLQLLTSFSSNAANSRLLARVVLWTWRFKNAHLTMPSDQLRANVQYVNVYLCASDTPLPSTNQEQNCPNSLKKIFDNLDWVLSVGHLGLERDASFSTYCILLLLQWKLLHGTFILPRVYVRGRIPISPLSIQGCPLSSLFPFCLMRSFFLTREKRGSRLNEEQKDFLRHFPFCFFFGVTLCSGPFFPNFFLIISVKNIPIF